jgi:S-adenosylmethionine decarboxylase
MNEKTFGYELIIDLYGCDVNVMKSKKRLKEYVEKLCVLIKMEKYGQTLLKYFGTKKAHTKGYSLLQFIETSSITGHFSEYWGSCYVNIFSCKHFNHLKARKFTKNFFKAKNIKSKFIKR